MPTKPDLSLEGFLASSAPLEVQLQRARSRGDEPAGKSFSFGGQAQQDHDSQKKRATVGGGTLEAIRAAENGATGKDVLEGDSEEEEEVAPTRSFLNLFGSFARKPSNGGVSLAEVLDGVQKDKFVRNATLRDALSNGDTVLVKGSWLVKRWKMGKKDDGAFGLPRRQELQTEHKDSIWQVDELFDQVSKGSVNIVAVSHCWLGSQHPDPQGTQLDILCKVIDMMLTQTPLKDLAMFIDYCSLYQEPRDGEQNAAFTRAFPNTHLWFLHQGTRVWMLTDVNPKAERGEAYDKRGWPILERALADMVTKNNFLLNLGKLDEKCTTWQKVNTTCKHMRSVPRLPSEFNEEIMRAVFLVREDQQFVMTKYDEGFLEAISAAEELSFSDANWGDDEAAQLALLLPQCVRLTKLALHGNKITEKGLMSLIGVLPRCEQLDQIWVTANAISKAKKETRERVIEAWVKTGRMRERLRM